MKKYFFLLFLFIIYLCLVINNKTLVEPVISYDDKYKDGVCDVTLEFEEGINSNHLVNLFNSYNDEYYIYGLSLKNKNLKLSCTNIENCIKNVYEQEDEFFSLINISSGFKVEEINFLAYENEVIKYLDDNNLAYKLK